MGLRGYNLLTVPSPHSLPPFPSSPSSPLLQSGSLTTRTTGATSAKLSRPIPLSLFRPLLARKSMMTSDGVLVSPNGAFPFALLPSVIPVFRSCNNNSFTFVLDSRQCSSLHRCTRVFNRHHAVTSFDPFSGLLLTQNDPRRLCCGCMYIYMCVHVYGFVTQKRWGNSSLNKKRRGRSG